MPELPDLHDQVLERAEAMTDARLIEMLLMTNNHARSLAIEEAEELYGGDTRGLPNTLQTEAALIETLLDRFVPAEVMEDAWALYAEEDHSG